MWREKSKQIGQLFKIHRASSVAVALHLILLIILLVAIPDVVHDIPSMSSAPPVVTVVTADVITEPQKIEPTPPPPPVIEQPTPPVPPVVQPEPKETPPPIPVVPVEKAKPKPKPKPVPKKPPLKKPEVKKPEVKKPEPKKTPPKKVEPKKVPQKTAQKTAPKKPELTPQQKAAAAKALQKMALSNINTSADQLQAQQAEDARLLTVKEKYMALIQQTVRANWINPLPDQQLEVTLAVKLDLQGNVLSVVVLKSSGNAVFDRQVMYAVNKSSPLPVPDDDVLKAEFSNIQLLFSSNGQ